MSKKLWPRRAECVNAILVASAIAGDLRWSELVLNGTADELFDRAVRMAGDLEGTMDTFVNIALVFNVPVDGLKVEGRFGKKWHEVVQLCKEPDSIPVPLEAEPFYTPAALACAMSGLPAPAIHPDHTRLTDHPRD